MPSVDSTPSRAASGAPNTGPGKPGSAPPSGGSTALAAPPEALAAYSAMLADVTAVAETADYRNPRLASHMKGQALTFWTQNLIDQHAKGLVSHGSPVSNPQVTKVSPADHPDRVEVSDCLDGTHWLKYKRDGGLADDVPGGRHISATAIVRQPDGSWLVEQQLIGAVGSC
ncbi:hypothetical protein [Kitasatospora arboriphila]|uniref:hypothetical protein n=1 Tax=Kitasatospora arboriphila TaxID=258052 RepID=UPI0031CF013B